MISKMIDFLALISVRASSMLAMSVSLLFIWWQGGIEQVGIFSGITAIVTPVVAFSQYRYVEYLSLANSKSMALSTTITSSLFSYCVIILLTLPWYIYFYGNGFFVVLMSVYKCFEMLTDIYIAYLSITKSRKKIRVIVITRLSFIILGFFAIFLVNKFYEIDIIFFVSLILSLIFSILFFLDFRKVQIRVKKEYIREYIYSNINYGFSSLTISFNSLLPRYFYIYTGDSKTLGVYSIIYLFSANLVTLIQYPISINALFFNKFVSNNKIFISSASIVTSIFSVFILYILNVSEYLFYIASMVLIFISLSMRALLITSIVTLDLRFQVLKILLLSLIISFLVVVTIKVISGNSFELVDGIFYTVFSGCISVLLSYYYRFIYEGKIC